MAKPIKKRFFEVSAPLTHAKISLFADSEEELNGKHVKIDLTRSLKGKSYEYYLKVVLNGKQLEAIPKSLILTGSYVRRMMRTGVDYSEDSFVAETRDNKVQVKTFMITRNRVSRGVLRELRNNSRKYLEGYLKTRDTLEAMSELMSNKIQRDLGMRLKKIYPLALCEVRWFEILGEKGIEEVPKEAKEVLNQGSITPIAKEEVKEEKVKKTRAKKVDKEENKEE